MYRNLCALSIFAGTSCLAVGYSSTSAAFEETNSYEQRLSIIASLDINKEAPNEFLFATPEAFAKCIVECDFSGMTDDQKQAISASYERLKILNYLNHVLAKKTPTPPKKSFWGGGKADVPTAKYEKVIEGITTSSCYTRALKVGVGYRFAEALHKNYLASLSLIETAGFSVYVEDSEPQFPAEARESAIKLNKERLLKGEIDQGAYEQVMSDKSLSMKQVGIAPDIRRYISIIGDDGVRYESGSLIAKHLGYVEFIDARQIESSRPQCVIPETDERHEHIYGYASKATSPATEVKPLIQDVLDSKGYERQLVLMAEWREKKALHDQNNALAAADLKSKGELSNSRELQRKRLLEANEVEPESLTEAAIYFHATSPDDGERKVREFSLEPIGEMISFSCSLERKVEDGAYLCNTTGIGAVGARLMGFKVAPQYAVLKIPPTAILSGELRVGKRFDVIGAHRENAEFSAANGKLTSVPVYNVSWMKKR